jgi:DNA-binding CsgD family transcriptional regulator
VTSASALAEAGVSGRETEVLALLGEHLSHAEIAARLFISVRTVESHVAALRRKLCVGTHRELVRLAAGYLAAETGSGPGASPRLPAPLTSFVGRDGERAALAAALDTSRLVSAVGPGGIGKTRLALAVAADVADGFSGTWYADLVPVTDPALLPAAVLACLGADESSSRPAQDALAAALGERRALLAAPAGAAGDAGRRVAGICRALGGMPLAIELAAARLPSLGLDGLEAGLGDQLSLLSGGSRQQQRHRAPCTTRWTGATGCWIRASRRSWAGWRCSPDRSAWPRRRRWPGMTRWSRPGSRTRWAGSPSTACWCPPPAPGGRATTPWNRSASSPRPGSAPTVPTVPTAGRPVTGTWLGA